jgi:hypothetical protein
MKGATRMDFWQDIAIAVILRILKDRKESKKWEAALMKIHGAIETMFPQLAMPADDNTKGQP